MTSTFVPVLLEAATRAFLAALTVWALLRLLRVGNVLALAAGAKTSGETLVLPVKLVVRASTGPPPALQCSRNSISPALGTTKVSGSAANSAGSTDAGSR